MATRKKSGRVHKVEYEKPLFVGSFSSIVDAVNKGGEGLVLNEKNCANIVYQIQNFMEDNCGRQSPEPRVITKIPFHLFRDFKSGGSLECILKTVVQFMKDNSWNSFDITGPEGVANGLALLQKIEVALIRARFLQRPIVFFGKGTEQLADTLEKIVLSHGGFLCGSAEQATHVIEWDDEVDNLPDELVEEYVRTLELRPLENGGVALVHWYYYPDSYDEWISSQDVDAVEPPDIYPLRGHVPQHGSRIDPSIRCQPWRLCCRFIRDCNTFNEWGNEVDYEIVDDIEQETDEDAIPDNGAAVSNSRSSRSPANGRKSKKGDSAKKTAAQRRDLPIPESTSNCTDKMMQDVPPPSLDRKRQKVAIVDIPAAIAGAASAAITISLEPTNKNKMDVEVAEVSKTEVDVEGSGSKKRKSDGHIVSSNVRVPSWFEPNAISSYEIRYLPGFFSAGYNQQQREAYLLLRGAIIGLYQQNPHIYLSATECRRRMAGDVCAIIRLHEFLDAFGIVNTYVRPENRPPLPSLALLQPPIHVAPIHNADPKAQQKSSDIDKLLVIIGYRLNGDWAKVSQVLKQKYGLHLSPEDCLARFVEIPSESMGSYIRASSSSSSSAGATAAPGEAQSEHKMEVDDSSSSGHHHGGNGAVVASDAAVLRHACSSLPAHASAADVKSLVAQLIGGGGAGMANEDDKVKGAITSLAEDSVGCALQSTDAMVDDYVNLRLRALEEKVVLLASVKKEIQLERRQLELERRDIQIQRALLASQTSKV